MRTPTRCWNWFQPSDQERERGEPSLIAGITRQVIEAHGADVSRVYIAGLSAGGAQAAMRGTRTAATNGRAARPFVPTIVFHGARDRTVDPGNAEAILGQALADAPALTVLQERGRVPGGHGY